MEQDAKREVKLQADRAERQAARQRGRQSQSGGQPGSQPDSPPDNDSASIYIDLTKSNALGEWIVSELFCLDQPQLARMCVTLHQHWKRTFNTESAADWPPLPSFPEFLLEALKAFQNDYINVTRRKKCTSCSNLFLQISDHL